MKKRHILLSQSVYYFFTGLWPLVNIATFMKVTGPKTDIWLVKMVGALTIAISVALFSSYRSGVNAAPVLAICSALAYFTIDVYYFLNGTISFVYLIDALIESVIVFLLLRIK